MATTTAATRRATKKAQTAPPRRTAKAAPRPPPAKTGSGRRAAPHRRKRRQPPRRPSWRCPLRATRWRPTRSSGIRRKEVLSAASTLLTRLARQPRAVSRQYAKFLRRTARRSRRAVRRWRRPAGTAALPTRRGATARRFRRLLQAYVALGRTLDACVDDAQLDATDTDRARFVVSLLVDAMAPTNFIVTNPAALKKAVDTKGASVIRGLANLVEDLAERHAAAEAGRRPAVQGRHATWRIRRGAVVFRNEMLELIQYAPTTPEVHARPLLIVPPQINKYYVFDLAPAKSIVQWSLGSGVQTFVVSWRNPTREHARLGARRLRRRARGGGRRDARDHRVAATSTSGARAPAASR